jgi:uncharacterized RDD family membrane protein YckC
LSEVVTGEAVVLDVPCARFPSRMLAIILDMTVQIVLIIVLFAVIGATGSHLNAASLAAIAVTALVLIIVGYPTAFETLSRGRSLGKMALGLRVVGDDGGPERFRQALVRALASIVEIWALTGAPALICSLLSAKGKRLGDVFAGTFVIQERLPRRQSLPAMLAVVPPPLVGWAQTLELSGLNDETAEQASTYLRRFYELSPAARDEFGQRIAAAVAAQVSPPPPPGTPPAAFLSAVLAVRRHREMARLSAMSGMAAGPYATPGGPYPTPGMPGPPPPWMTGPPGPWMPGQAGPWMPPPAGPWPPGPVVPGPVVPGPVVPGPEAPARPDEPGPAVPAHPEPPAPGSGGFAPPV